MSLVCCLLTKPRLIFAAVRSLHWDVGDDDTHAISWKVAFDFFRHTVGTTHPDECCFFSSHSDSLDHLPRCFTVLDVYDSIRVAANLPPISDGRLSLMLQERREGSVVASIVAFFAAIWNVRSMCRRGVRFLSFIELRDLVLVSLQCPWLVRCCPTRSNKQRRQDRILPPLPTPRVTISHNLQV